MVDQRSTGAQPYQQKTHDVATSAEATTFMHRMNGKGLQIFPSSLNASLTTSNGPTIPVTAKRSNRSNSTVVVLICKEQAQSHP